jgi:hypothetical protein
MDRMLSGTAVDIAKSTCTTCEQLSRSLLQLAYQHLRAEQHLLELTFTSKDAVTLSAAAVSAHTLLRKRSELILTMNSHRDREHTSRPVLPVESELELSYHPS